ncbi:MAG TPA: 2-oxoglutarate dehydrogenase E1 component [Gammaproteobacteria bacterium]|nr:2-oxoglutarate dehydrogenase E1 component [Gammaproteobacteria bacterium]
MSDELREKYRTSPLYGGNAAFIESFYEDFLRDPDSVTDPHWRAYFEQLAQSQGDAVRDVPHRPIQASFARYALEQAGGARAVQPISPEGASRQAAVLRLINAYRVRGHQAAHLDPLGLSRPAPVPDLDPGYHGLSERDMEAVFDTGSLYAEQRLPLREIIQICKRTYTQNIGSEYMHITDTEQKRWIQKRLEGGLGRQNLTDEERRRFLLDLTAAEGIEKYLHTRYVGQKRFSLEGGDALIPQLDDLIRQAGEQEVEEVVIGMAHRGRLNVLVNILGKSPKELFEEFEGQHAHHVSASGDVKYHMGFSSDVAAGDERRIHLVLAFNPSHLEIVNPVVLGSVRSRQERREDGEGRRILPILIHGDAAFAGQGVVMETFNMSQARGFAVGGTVHIVINNQVGFTTSNPMDARSTPYATDVAKMVQPPIFHVNADDTEAVVFVTRLALEFRMAFRKDVVIDLVCYRRHGHNEADEPAVTQPLMYQTIAQHPTCRAVYAGRLVAEGIVSSEEAESYIDQYRDGLDEGVNVIRPTARMIGNEYTVDWTPYLKANWDDPVETALPLARVRELSQKLLELPPGWELHPRVGRIMDDRRKMAAGAVAVDWGFAETLAYASLLSEGMDVRLCGQDSGRGTFFHRHSVLYNQQDGTPYVPLRHVAERQGDFWVIDSLLSEEGVVAFEYGYASADPATLDIWEAQFGDFGNGAQVVIDQFISSGEAKWGRLCGLTMFLPHGYEGQGPEHSSARLERYLQLCAEQNMQVCVPTTPAQMFHMLRRQMVRPYRKPLIVMTPKSLLRKRTAMSALDELSAGTFRCVIDDDADTARSKIRRVIICTGKVYYDLRERRESEAHADTAVLRVEQLYPFPREQLRVLLETYPRAREVVWCQEEPKNQGAWHFVQVRLQRLLRPSQTLRYAGRAASASTAAGYFELHAQQQRRLVSQAFGEHLAELASAEAEQTEQR